MTKQKALDARDEWRPASIQLSSRLWFQCAFYYPYF